MGLGYVDVNNTIKSLVSFANMQVVLFQLNVQAMYLSISMYRRSKCGVRYDPTYN